MEVNKPKTRIELYNEKLKERGNDNFLDRFTENGAGAPLRNIDGTIMTKRRTMMNDNYEDIMLNQRRITPNPMYNNNNINNINQQSNLYPKFNNINNMESDYNYLNNNNYRTLRNRTPNINIFNDNNNINNRNQNDSIINNNFQMTNINRRPQSQINFSDTLSQYSKRNNINQENNNNMENDPYGNHYEGAGILPKEKTNDIDKRNQNQILREEWLKEIEEKKIRDAQRKKEQQELDLKFEERYRRDIAEEMEKEKLKEMERQQNEENTRNINRNIIENNKNNFQNQNNQEAMIMNGNNLEPIQSQSQSQNQIQEDTNFFPQEQNFRILRNPNNDINNYLNNNNINNNYEHMELNEFGLDSDPRELEDNINEQIAKLRNDVNSQYLEMSNLFGKLKMDVIEANQLKNEAEKELLYIKKELAKNKMASLAYDAQLNQVLEKHAPYNNMHINIKDVDPLYSLRNARKDLQSTSNMIYETDMINEQNVNRVKQLSALAQAGQNLVGLKAESEFIPINNPGENNEFNSEGNNLNNNFGNELNNDPKSNIAISKTGYKNLESESYQIFQQNKEPDFEKNKDEPKILDEYMKKGDYSNMYKQLVDIANINHAMGGENKLKTLSKNYEIDYKTFNDKHMEQQKKNINQIDQLLSELN